MPPELVAFGGAWLACLLANEHSIHILVKAESQRTSKERNEVARGLLKSTLLDFFLFASASTLVSLLLLPFLVNVSTRLNTLQQVAPKSFYALLGFFSYQFPFRLLRQKVQAWALRRLNRFAEAVKVLKS
jgi:hypothetical protein